MQEATTPPQDHLRSARRLLFVLGALVALVPVTLQPLLMSLRSPFGVSPMMFVSSGASLVRAIPPLALIAVLWMAEDRYRVVYWLLPLWFACTGVSMLVWHTGSLVVGAPGPGWPYWISAFLELGIAAGLLAVRPQQAPVPEQTPATLF